MKTIEIIRINLKQDVKNYINPLGAKISNNLTSLYFFSIATAIQKKICLASQYLPLLFERNEFIEFT